MEKKKMSTTTPALAALLLPLLLLLLLQLPPPSSPETITGDEAAGCQRTCAGVIIPYPFGLSEECSRQGFQLDCIHDDHGRESHPQILSQFIEVTSISIEDHLVRAVNRVFAFDLDITNRVTAYQLWDYDLSFADAGSYYTISPERNVFATIGCNAIVTLSIASATKNNTRFAQCGATCLESDTDPLGTKSLVNGSCNGVGCCQLSPPAGLTAFRASATAVRSTSRSYIFSNATGFLVDKDWFYFTPDYLSNTSNIFNNANATVPFIIDWAIRDNTSASFVCGAGIKPDDYACLSDNSDCVYIVTDNIDYAVASYKCFCSPGYFGNPYIRHG